MHSRSDLPISAHRRVLRRRKGMLFTDVKHSYTLISILHRFVVDCDQSACHSCQPARNHHSMVVLVDVFQ